MKYFFSVTIDLYMIHDWNSSKINKICVSRYVYLCLALINWYILKQEPFLFFIVFCITLKIQMLFYVLAETLCSKRKFPVNTEIFFIVF